MIGLRGLSEPLCALVWTRLSCGMQAKVLKRIGELNIKIAAARAGKPSPDWNKISALAANQIPSVAQEQARVRFRMRLEHLTACWSLFAVWL